MGSSMAGGGRWRRLRCREQDDAVRPDSHCPEARRGGRGDATSGANLVLMLVCCVVLSVLAPVIAAASGSSPMPPSEPPLSPPMPASGNAAPSDEERRT